MRADLDIIYFTLFPWDNAYSSVSLSFTREFQKNNRVFYINHPYSVKDFMKGWRQPMVKERRRDMMLNRMRYESVPGMHNVIAVHPPLTLPINWMNPGERYDKFYAINNRIILNTIKQVIKDYNLTDYIYLNCFNPYYAGVLPKGEFNPLLNIYTCIDDMTEEEYTAKHGARLEEDAMRKADIAFVTSHNLKKLKKHLNPNTHILHNAVDISIFEKALDGPLPRPKELEGITGKIIGYTGNINEYRLNYPLFKKIATEHSDKTLVIVGPLNSDDYIAHGLDQMPNVVFTGGKDINELPAFLQHFDIAIIPFLLNKLTASIYPLKINEYLAAGKPVVATNFSEDIRTFAKDIYIADSEEEFVKLINKGLAEDSDERIAQRAATARKNTWEERVREFWEVVEAQLDKKGKDSAKELASSF
ncbi:MAG TPA: glycosyltransferase family 1 protein [Bacteroidetes bacterium]|nr:glycosyltransferase family 1 protein [Bacteroidota bacterium]